MGEAKTKLEIKKALFEEDPDQFILKSDLVIGILKNKKNDQEAEYSCMIGRATELDLCTAYGLITGEFVKLHLLAQQQKIADKNQNRRILLG